MTLVPLHWQKLGFLDWQIGWLAASFSLAAITARVGLGEWLERWGRRPFLVLGPLLLTSVCFLFDSVGHNFWGWLTLRVVQGIGLALALTSMLTWITDRSPPEAIGQRQGLFGVSGLLGSAAGPLVAEWIVHRWGFPTMFLALGMAGLTAAGLALTLPESRTDRPTRRRTSFASVMGTPALRPMLLATLPFGWFAGTVMTFLAPLVKQAGLSGVGIFFSGFAVASVLVRVAAGHTIDRVAPGRLIPASLGMLVFSSALLTGLSQFPSQAVLVAAALLNGIGHGFLFPALSLFTVKRLAPEQHGTGMAVFTGCFEAGILMGAVGAGYVSEYASTVGAFAAAGVLLCLGLPAFALSRRSNGGNKGESGDFHQHG